MIRVSTNKRVPKSHINPVLYNLCEHAYGCSRMQTVNFVCVMGSCHQCYTSAWLAEDVILILDEMLCHISAIIK